MRFGIGASAICLALMTAVFTSTSFVASATAGQYWDNEKGEWVTYRDSASTLARKARKKFKRKIIPYDGKETPGTIIVDTKKRQLLHVMKGGTAMRYGIGVGREGFEWKGRQRISRKAEWPGWTPPPEMVAREKRENGRDLPAFMEGGPNNPLGARALYLGDTIYRIHGTNEDWSIGLAMSSGCIRMFNDDVEYLYDQVKVGTKVIVR
ncbi:L,D-transpeptidase [Polycladidibacter stylochi]|uniref:L,D-transpeptidase n=1 Tax=Polycladidibacter stylochi TaxID=1807766 RepID=UPI000833AC7A|nr:L,D-transpeptidase [Pseudovibrio stylochi]